MALPCLVLICSCYVVGVIVAELESGNEIDGNNSALAHCFHNNRTFSSVKVLLEESPVDCLNAFDDSTGSKEIDMDALRESLAICGAENSVTYSYKEYDGNAGIFALDCIDVQSFGWTRCPFDSSANLDVNNAMAIFTENEWLKSYRAIYEEETANGLSKEEAESIALEEASGFDDCEVNHDGGALFIFTVMTTIGYGNFSPTTVAGRLCVFSFGFVLILAFAAVNSNAGTNSLTVFDHFARSKGWNRLTNGWVACAFWYIMLCLWLCVFAQIVIWFDKHDVNETSYFDSLWFSFVTMTTVGFGDIAFAQDDFTTRDMFIIPYLTLLGFVFLANFLLKVSDYFSELFPADTSLEDLLDERCSTKNQEEDIAKKIDIEETES